jgi:LPXTG-motif cell wall-anchored protein
MTHNRSRSLAVALALIVAFLAALAPTASANEYAPPPPKAMVSGSPKAGGNLVITGVTKPLAEVVVTLDRSPGPDLYTATSTRVLGSTVSGADGSYSLSITVPAGLGAGPWFLTVSADGEVLTTMAVDGAEAPAGHDEAVTDVAADASPRAVGAAAGQLPVTGSTTTLLLLLVGVGLVAAGGSTLVIGRSRRAVQATA